VCPYKNKGTIRGLPHLSYDLLSDEDKLEEAIQFVAVGQPLPDTLEAFLRDAGLYDAIVKQKP
jgi:hypothetical protein